MIVLLTACDSGLSGAAQCAAAGGRCVLGASQCSNVGPQDCNPTRNPGGAFCCLDPVCSDGGSDVIIDISRYDSSCKADSDCVAVGAGNFSCAPCLTQCRSHAINVVDYMRYSADVSATPIFQYMGGCACTSAGPCCVNGVCHADLACAGP